MAQGRQPSLKVDSATFGAFLKYLRRCAGLTQRALGMAVGYSEAQISRLEHNHRPPERAAVAARFVHALGLETEPDLAQRLLDLTFDSSRKEDQIAAFDVEVGFLETIPASRNDEIPRPQSLEKLREGLVGGANVLLHGLPGTGKTTLSATLARQWQEKKPIFWHTISGLETAPVAAFFRQLALFLVTRHVQESALIVRLPNYADVAAFERHLALLCSVVQSHPILICIDDFHLLAGNQHSRNWFMRWLQESRAQHLLIAREQIPLKNVSSLLLEGMTENETHVLLHQFGLKLAPDLLQRLNHITQGNPLLLRLVASQMRQNRAGFVELIGRLATQSEISLYLLNSALDGLTPASQTLLELLSVCRMSVNLYDIQPSNLLHTSGLVTDLGETIQELQRRDLLENPGEALIHPLVREHFQAYLKTQPETYRRLHALIAEWYRRSQFSLIETIYHFVQSGDPPKAIAFLDTRLNQLETSRQITEAVELVDLLLKQIRSADRPASPDEWMLLALRGRLLTSTVRAVEAESDLRQALALALEGGAPGEIQARLSLTLAKTLLQRSQAGEALELCQEAEAAIPDGNPSLYAQMEAIRTVANLMQTKLEDALDHARRALQIVKLLPRTDIKLSAEVRLQVLNTQAIIEHIRRDIPAALTHWRQAEEAALLAERPQLAFRFKANIAATLFDRGDLDAARQAYEDILDAVQALGDTFALGKILNSLGAIYHLQGKESEALEILSRARRFKELSGDLQGLATTENQRALVLLAQGHIQEAHQVVERLIKESEETGEMRWRGSYLDTLAMVHLASSEFAQARQTIEVALDLPGVAEDPQLTTYLFSHLTLAYLGCEEIQSAASALSQARTQTQSGTVKLEADLAEALVSRAENQRETAFSKLEALEREADAHSLFFYVQIAQRVRKALVSRRSLSQCISQAMAPRN
jgi:ATP/maltotriose-dependent transcriptional regulator MalT